MKAMRRSAFLVSVGIFFLVLGCSKKAGHTEGGSAKAVVQAATVNPPDPPKDWNDGATVRVLDIYVNPETKVRAMRVQNAETHEMIFVRCPVLEGPAGITCRQPKKTINYKLTASPQWYSSGCDDGSYYMTPVSSGDDHFDGKTLNVCLWLP